MGTFCFGNVLFWVRFVSGTLCVEIFREGIFLDLVKYEATDSFINIFGLRRGLSFFSLFFSF